jgi:hypothetical protein
MKAWGHTGLLLAIIIKWFGGRVLADDITDILCAQNVDACSEIFDGESRTLAPIFDAKSDKFGEEGSSKITE